MISSSRPMRRKNNVPKPMSPAGPAIQLGRRNTCARAQSQDAKPGAGNAHEPAFSRVMVPAGLRRVPRAPVVRVADDEPGRRAKKPDQLGKKQAHYVGCAARAGAGAAALYVPSASTNSSSP